MTDTHVRDGTRRHLEPSKEQLLGSADELTQKQRGHAEPLESVAGIVHTRKQKVVGQFVLVVVGEKRSRIRSRQGTNEAKNALLLAEVNSGRAERLGQLARAIDAVEQQRYAHTPPDLRAMLKQNWSGSTP